MTATLIKWLIFAALVAGALFYTYGKGHKAGYDEREISCTADIATQKTNDATACSEAQAITEGENHDLHKNLDAVQHRLDAERLRHPARCVPVKTVRDASVAHVAEPAGQLSGPDGLSSLWLETFAAQCETVRQVALSCTDFVSKVEKSYDASTHQ